jgi:Antitoxin VbhA
MDTRANIAAGAVGSVRAEGLEPGTTVTEILDQWVDGQIETEQLGEAAQRLAAGESVVHLLRQPQPEPVTTRR